MKNIILLTVLLFLSRLAFGQGGKKEVFICNGTNIRIKATSTGANGFEWRRNNQIIPGFSGSELLTSEEGSYTAVALNIDGCASDQSVIIALEFRKPVAVNDYIKGTRNTVAYISPLENDATSCAELDPATIVVKTTPGKGSVSIVDGQFVYQPLTDFSDVAEFKYTVRDKTGQESNIATVTVDYSGALPVVLTNFKAVKQESTTLLSWVTTSESNSEKFAIERSTDGKNWTGIAYVDAKGNSSENQDYAYTDNSPESGINYYRLKMIDLDGSLAYSIIRSVHFPEFSWATLYPNPVSHTLHISIRNKEVKKLRLINPTGQVLLRSDVSSKEMDLNMQPYSSGVFFVHLEQENGLVSIFKIFHE
ncbi:MAG TPA: Ig-like domain-containing protein [Dyadobacter sp.]|jgi:hypothetical protein|nr:Ig-like domain-containing protein [Dyadobacter sp.]